MYKDFDDWNLKKKKINLHTEPGHFRQGDIWWCSVGVNIGTEPCGKGENFRRPVLVFKKLSHDTFIGIPISMKPKVGSWYSLIMFGEKERYVLLHQTRTFDKKRLQRKICSVSDSDLVKIKEKLRVLLELF